MQSASHNVQLVGFEKDADLGGLLASFGLFMDYKSELPDHILGILKQQHPDVLIERIELLTTPKCNLGGMKQPQSETHIRVQTLDVPLDLRVTLRVREAHLALDVQLVMKCEGLDSTPSVQTNMFVKSQQAV